MPQVTAYDSGTAGDSILAVAAAPAYVARNENHLNENGDNNINVDFWNVLSWHQRVSYRSNHRMYVA